MKYSKNFEETYNFYLNNYNKLTFSGIDKNSLGVTYSLEGKTAKECFFIFDSQGMIKPCAEPELLINLINFKKSLNLHIKLWAEGFHECMQPTSEYLSIFNNPPMWVKDALNQQILKITNKRIKAS